VAANCSASFLGQAVAVTASGAASSGSSVAASFLGVAALAPGLFGAAYVIRSIGLLDQCLA